MSEIKGITNAVTGNINNIKPSANGSTVKPSFSSYMEEKKDLDQIFEEASAKYNVPVELLKAIGKAESDFRIDAVSKSGAQGVMQLMPKTAEYLGVKDSFDPEQNIMGGSKYIKELLDKYDGDINLALAAYNAGMNNVAKYGGIPPFKETQNYVVKVNKYMQQNLEAGTATVSVAMQNKVQAAQTPLNNWHIMPSELTQKAAGDNSSLTELLDSIFSYNDYLKLLDYFFRDMDNSER